MMQKQNAAAAEALTLMMQKQSAAAAEVSAMTSSVGLSIQELVNSHLVMTSKMNALAERADAVTVEMNGRAKDQVSMLLPGMVEQMLNDHLPTPATRDRAAATLITVALARWEADSIRRHEYPVR